MTDESNIGVWLWIILLVTINAMWVGMDLWLRAHHHEYLTDEFKEGLHGPYGAVLAGTVGFTIAAFVGHMWTR